MSSPSSRVERLAAHLTAQRAASGGDAGGLDFAGQVCLVTGSARGIGAAIAQQLAVRGARVVVHCKSNMEAARRTLASLATPPEAGGKHILRQAAVEDPSACKHLVESVIEEAGRIDVLVNCAGIYAEHPPLAASTDYAAWRAAWRWRSSSSSP